MEKTLIQITLQEKQDNAFQLSLETPVLFYGGAKGGGKSYLVRAREVYRRLHHPNTKGLIVRKTYPELLSNHIRMMFTEYPPVKEWFKFGEKAIYWPNGSITEFSYLKGTDDVYTYQGREYEDISIDEITQHDELVFQILRSSNRTSNKQFVKEGGKPSMLLTGNPGGVGHGWVKRLFIDKQYSEDEKPSDYAFVQAKVWDNRMLLDADPAYIERLQALPEDLRRAYLEGDWDIFAGQVFGEFRRDYHVIKSITPKESYPHFLWIDWGYSGKSSDEGAFACYAAAILKEKYEGQEFNRVVVYREWYGKYKTPDEWAEQIYKQRPVGKFVKGYCDPAMFNRQTDGSIPIAQLMEKKWNELNKGYWMALNKGTNNRVARVATLHNWLSMAPDGLPYMLITQNCENLIRTLPLLVYDPVQVEDVDTETEDHPYDAITYGLSAVKFTSLDLGGVEPKRLLHKGLPPFVEKLDLDVFGTAKEDKKSDWRTV